MTRYIIWLLRSCILLLILLPVIIPSLEREKTDARFKPIVVLAQKNLLSNYKVTLKLEQYIRKTLGSNRTLELRTFTSENNNPLLNFQELGNLIEHSQGIIVVFSDDNLWGSASHKFNNNLKKTQAFKNREIYWLPPHSIIDDYNTNYFIGINDIFVPNLSFLGDESKVSIDIVGKLSNQDSLDAEVVLRLGESVLATKSVSIDVDNKGVVNQTIEIPVHFVKPGTQVLTAQLISNKSKYPLDMASTTVNIVHAKTTALHIALGPDWSLRNFRQKLKFWPNLDLVSYYILRDFTSDASIPSSQLSLIEFPSDKLFGEQLQNFHGVVVQNFPFGGFLSPTESKNLLNYVHNGGRLVIQAGPLSFSAADSSISSLFPCKNPPNFDTENTYSWEAVSDNLVVENGFLNSLANIKSRATAINCQPVESALVLARTTQGHHPTILAMPLGKGLVVSVLSGDWHIFPLQIPLRDEPQKFARFKGAQAADELFRWLVEFLQRRQDSGMRPPDIAGPRLYSDDNIIPIRSRGMARIDIPLKIYSQDESIGQGRVVWLPFLETEALKLSQPLGLKQSTSPLHLEFETGQQVKRIGLWPIFPQTMALQENLSNPLVFLGVPTLSPSAQNEQEVRKYRNRELLPLIEVYPFLLALALALLALEQYLVHIRWRHSIAIKDVK